MRKPIVEVRKKLLEQGKTLTRMAEDLGIHYYYMLDILHGRRKSRKVIEQVAAYLGYPELVELYEEEFAGVK